MKKNLREKGNATQHIAITACWQSASLKVQSILKTRQIF
jgi:hypothetical protein